MKNEAKGLQQLGSKETNYPQQPSEAKLETFLNQFPAREYTVTFECPEFTSLCPKTKQPDFAHITICYDPDKLCIESKSLKLYLFSFRNYGSFMEHITNTILDDLVAVCAPRFMEIMSKFYARGGIETVVEASYVKSV